MTGFLLNERDCSISVLGLFSPCKVFHILPLYRYVQLPTTDYHFINIRFPLVSEIFIFQLKDKHNFIYMRRGIYTVHVQ